MVHVPLTSLGMPFPTTMAEGTPPRQPATVSATSTADPIRFDRCAIARILSILWWNTLLTGSAGAARTHGGVAARPQRVIGHDEGQGRRAHEQSGAAAGHVPLLHRRNERARHDHGLAPPREHVTAVQLDLRH